MSHLTEVKRKTRTFEWQLERDLALGRTRGSPVFIESEEFSLMNEQTKCCWLKITFQRLDERDDNGYRIGVKFECKKSTWSSDADEHLKTCHGVTDIAIFLQTSDGKRRKADSVAGPRYVFPNGGFRFEQDTDNNLKLLGAGNLEINIRCDITQISSKQEETYRRVLCQYPYT